MICNHTRITTQGVGSGYCRCLDCQACMPVGEALIGLSNEVQKLTTIISLFERRVEQVTESHNGVYDHLTTAMSGLVKRQDEFEAKMLAAVTEEAKPTEGDLKLAKAIEDTEPPKVKIVIPKKKKKKTKQGRK